MINLIQTRKLERLSNKSEDIAKATAEDNLLSEVRMPLYQKWLASSQIKCIKDVSYIHIFKRDFN